MFSIENAIEQVNGFMSSELFESDIQFENYLYYLTGKHYTIAQSMDRKWGSIDAPVERGHFFQIIPETEDSGFLIGIAGLGLTISSL